MKWMDMEPGEMSPSSTQIQFGQKILLRHWALQKQNALKEILFEKTLGQVRSS